MVRAIHMAAARYNCEFWAQDPSLKMCRLKSCLPSEQFAATLHAKWASESNALCLSGTHLDKGLCYKNFEWLTRNHPTIAIGICLLRQSDINFRIRRRVSSDAQLLAADTSNLFGNGAQLINLGYLPPESPTNPFGDCVLNSVNASDRRVSASIKGVKYVPSGSFMEAFVSRGHVKYSLSVSNEVCEKTRDIVHQDFLRLYENLVDDYPKETRLSGDEIELVKSFPFPTKSLAKFSPEDLLDRKNTWNHFLDIVQTIDSQRVRVSLAELVEG